MRAGINARTGELLTSWAHCVQSIADILTTWIGERVMLRGYGNAGLELQDRNATPRRIMQVYAGIAQALREWEPGFRLRTIQLTRYGADGVFAFVLTGIFYENGHLGDYSQPQERSAMLAVNDNGFLVLGAVA